MILPLVLVLIALLIVIAGFVRLQAFPKRHGSAGPLAVWFCLFVGGAAIWALFAR